jgi:Fic family protein
MKYKTGEFQEQPDGCICFIPANLPLNPPIEYAHEILASLSDADRALSFLDAIIGMVPDPELLSFMFARKEALLSAQIEGTEATFIGLLSYEANIESEDNPDHIQQVVNNFKAITKGTSKIKKEPISISLICSLHKILLTGVRGKNKMPGRIRPIQNFIGGDDCHSAKYVPPPQEDVMFRLTNLIEYINLEDKTPPLIKAALIYAFFELIHPFLDGNGRVGRLLIIMFLLKEKVIEHPILTISYYLKEKRKEHYLKLGNISKEGDVEAWVQFFLTSVVEASNLTKETSQSIVRMKKDLDNWVINNDIGGINGIKMNNVLFSSPIFSIPIIRDHCNISHQAAARLVKKYVDAGYIVETTGKTRYKQYKFVRYIELLSKGTQLH